MSIVREICGQSTSPDVRLARLATKQHGVVARWQLLAIGFTPDTIQHALAAARLFRIRRGVYAVGHRRLTTHGRPMAAVLGCGPQAVLSHRSAIAHWGLRPAPIGPIEVLVPGSSRRSRHGIRVHHTHALPDEETAIYDGVPVTSLHRALLDFAAVAHRQEVRLAIEAAERCEKFDLREMNAVLVRNPTHRGCKTIREVLGEIKGPPADTRSELERRFLALIREAGLPEPQSNVLVQGFLVDLWWPQERLVVEIDSHGFHKLRSEFNSDRYRDAKLQLAGCIVLRVTDERMDNPAELLSDVIRFLSRRPGRAVDAAASNR